MAIKDLQKRVDAIYEITFGQIESKGGKKPKSQATRRFRRTLGANSLECHIKADVIAKTLTEQYRYQNPNVPANQMGEITADFKKFGKEVIKEFNNEHRIKQAKTKPYEYRGGMYTLHKADAKEIKFTISGFKRNDISFLRINKQASGRAMKKFPHLFGKQEAADAMEVAHKQGYSIVEAKGSLLGGEAEKLQGHEYGGVETAKLGEIGSKLKNISDYTSTIGLEGAHDMNVSMNNGKVVSTTTFKAQVEAKWQNREDAKTQSEMGSNLAALLKELREEIQSEYDNPERTVEEKNSRPIIDVVGDMIVMTPIKRRMYAKKKAINKTKYNVVPKSKRPTTASKTSTIKRKRQRIVAGGPDKHNAVSMGREAGRGEGKEDFAMQMRNLLKVKNAINRRLPAAVRRNMGRPALINRSSTLSNSVRIESIMPAAQTLMVKYNYKINPYETFEIEEKRDGLQGIILRH